MALHFQPPRVQTHAEVVSNFREACAAKKADPASTWQFTTGRTKFNRHYWAYLAQDCGCGVEAISSLSRLTKDGIDHEFEFRIVPTPNPGFGVAEPDAIRAISNPIAAPHYTVHVPEGGFLAVVFKGGVSPQTGERITEALTKAIPGAGSKFKVVVMFGDVSFVGVGPEATPMTVDDASGYTAALKGG